MPKIVIHVLDDVHGTTVAEKAYRAIADSFDEAGSKPFHVRSEDDADLMEWVRNAYRITNARLRETSGAKEWEVIVEGTDEAIQEYNEILEQLE